jgi:hypothetical protein
MKKYKHGTKFCFIKMNLKLWIKRICMEKNTSKEVRALADHFIPLDYSKGTD